MTTLYYIVIVAAFIGFALYYAAIIYIGYESIQMGARFQPDQFISAVMTIIGGTLATHFGMVFGFERANTRAVKENQPAPASTMLSGLQTAAAWAYFLSLVLAAGFFLANKFYFQQESPEILFTLTMTGLGVIGGLLAIGLNVTPPARTSS